MRGKPFCIHFANCAIRITPAGAGKTSRLLHDAKHGADHPRRCGENRIPKHGEQKYQGSPPQVRGKQKIKLGQDYAIGITPAGAGKTCTRKHIARVNGDHPRRCGENRDVSISVAVKQGSPPQVRGKLEFENRLPFESGITPAGAGKTLKRSFRNQPFCS